MNPGRQVPSPAAGQQSVPLFGTMLMGGFECSTHRLPAGRRLDVIAATGHDSRAAEDFRLLQAHGMGGARDGLRWHLIEAVPGRYDWSSALPQLRAARETGMVVVWDLLHYGVPDWLDLFSPRFVDSFATFAREFARLVAAETDSPPIVTPINEISFWAWAGGGGGFDPFAAGRGPEIKQQLVRASLAAAAAMRAVDSRIRIACAEPLIHIHPSDAGAEAWHRAEIHNESQFEALDMLLGRCQPDLGGSSDAVDIIGVNYYFNNQWIDGVGTLPLGDFRHLPLHLLLETVGRRYSQPLYIAETGTEGPFRPYWLRYICDEAVEATARGTHIGGICLYPVLSHLGWDDDRHCANGLFDGHSPLADRHPHAPLARELALQVERFDNG